LQTPVAQISIMLQWICKIKIHKSMAQVQVLAEIQLVYKSTNVGIVSDCWFQRQHSNRLVCGILGFSMG
jgi:hypothetical protein